MTIRTVCPGPVAGDEDIDPVSRKVTEFPRRIREREGRGVAGRFSGGDEGMSLKGGSDKEEIYNNAKEQHAALDSRLQMLLKKAYLSNDEEVEVKVLKKKKLYYKDLMEKTAEEMEKGKGN